MSDVVVNRRAPRTTRMDRVDGFIAAIRHAVGKLPSRCFSICKYRSSITNRIKESLDEGASGL